MRPAYRHDHLFPPPPHHRVLPPQSLVTLSITSVTRSQRFLPKGSLFTLMSFNMIPLFDADDEDYIVLQGRFEVKIAASVEHLFSLAFCGTITTTTAQFEAKKLLSIIPDCFHTILSNLLLPALQKWK